MVWRFFNSQRVDMTRAGADSATSSSFSRTRPGMIPSLQEGAARRMPPRSMHEKPTSFDIAFLAGVCAAHRVARTARQSGGQRRDAQAHRGDRAPAQLPGRQERLEPALAAFEHAGAAAVRGSDARRLADQSVLPLDAGLDHARLARARATTCSCRSSSCRDDWQQDYEDSRKADGIILLGYGDYDEYRPRLERLVEQGTHFVRWGRCSKASRDVSVGCDNFQGGLRSHSAPAVAAVAARSRSSARATSHYPEFLDRYRGYERALLEARVPTSSALQVDAITTEESGFQAACELRARGVRIRCDRRRQRPDRHRRAARAAGAAHRRATQVAVVGFDDIPAASLTNPPLTTVMQDTRRAGELLVETLLRQIAGDPAANSVIPTRLVIRKSG